MHDLAHDDKYRFHLAKPSDNGTRPLDVLTKSKEDWLGWKRYRGKAKERFPIDNIVSFAQISGNRFLFGGGV